MRVSYNWLKEYADFDLSPQELAQALTARGVTVETVVSANPGVEGVVVARVEEIERHPNADTLWVCQVDVGGGKRLQILTGAPNVRKGDLVPAAIPGARIPGKTLGVAMLRGMESHGMLCSPDEIGIPEGGEGILILPNDPELEPGMDGVEVLGLNDWILELDLTANYAAHCQSMVGVAQEVAALAGSSLRWPEIYTEDEPNTNAQKLITIEIEAPDLCPRYTARIVRGVRVGTSPAWLQARVRAAGMRPINNIVDISNLVMMELGQPLHHFDYDQIRGRKIIVRRGAAGEKFTTLDGQERTLDPDVLVIAEAEGAVALAGVMGGLESEVTDSTVNVLIESASFQNINNRRTALRFNLPSEAARRFTKGVDPSGCVRAADRAAELIAALAGGRVVRGHVDAYSAPVAPPVVVLRPERVNAHLGLHLSVERMEEHLTSLGMAVLTPVDLAMDLGAGQPGAEEEEGDDLGGRPVWTAIHQVSPVPVDPAAYSGWTRVAWERLEQAGRRLEALNGSEALVVVIPTRRLDLAEEIDLVEEIARSAGYDAIPAELPMLASARGGRTAIAEQVLALRRALAEAGLDEAVTHSLTHPRVLDKLQLPQESQLRNCLVISNPLYEERAALRTTILPSLLDTLQYNANRQVRDLSIFEVGDVYLPVPGQTLPAEPKVLGIALMGAAAPVSWTGPSQQADFYLLKGLVEQVLAVLDVPHWSVRRSQHPSLHPGRQAELLVAGEPAGVFGEVHPSVQEAWDLPATAYAAEIYLEKLTAAARPQAEYRPVPRYPAVSRDVALVIGQDVAAAQVEVAIRAAGGVLVERVTLFDLYQGEHVKAGDRSLAYNIVYRAPDRTLTDADVEVAHGEVRRALQGLGAELRS